MDIGLKGTVAHNYPHLILKASFKSIVPKYTFTFIATLRSLYHKQKKHSVSKPCPEKRVYSFICII